MLTLGKACTHDRISVVRKALQDHPNWLDKRSVKGESCLHVAGILGSVEVTELLLQQGANPNIRSTYELGLRMHPLSWNVYGGHVEVAKLLLQNGADVNLDVDKMDYSGGKITVLDILENILQGTKASENGGDGNSSSNSQYYQMKSLLTQYNAKRYSELESGLDGSEL